MTSSARTGWLKPLLGVLLLLAAGRAIVLAVFVLIGSAGVLAPLIVYLVAGEGAARTLDSWKAWAATHDAAVTAVLFLIFGFKLAGDGIAVLF